MIYITTRAGGSEVRQTRQLVRGCLSGMTSDSLKWQRFVFLATFVISVYHASAVPVASDNPCQSKTFFTNYCGRDPKNKPTFKGFENLKDDVKLGISSVCSTIEFLCLHKTQEDLKKMETKEVCESFSSSNGLAVDCEKEDKNEECKEGLKNVKTFMEKMGKREYCVNICHATDETKSVCEGLVQVQEAVSNTAAGADESKTEEGEAANQSSSVKKAEVKKPAIANENNSSNSNVEGGKEKLKSDEEMKQIEKGDNKKEDVNSTSKPDEKVKNDVSPSGEAGKASAQPVKESTTVTSTTVTSTTVTTGSAEKEEPEKGDEKDDKEASEADATGDEKDPEDIGGGQGAPGEEDKISTSTATQPPPQDPSEKEKGIHKHPDLDSDDAQQPEHPEQAKQPKPHLINHMNQKMIDSEKSYGHVMSYFFALTVICIICYLVFHNKQKLIALVLEGRQKPSGRRGARRSSSAQYRKLDNNLEEAGGPNSSTTFSQAVY